MHGTEMGETREEESLMITPHYVYDNFFFPGRDFKRVKEDYATLPFCRVEIISN